MGVSISIGISLGVSISISVGVGAGIGISLVRQCEAGPSRALSASFSSAVQF